MAQAEVRVGVVRIGLCAFAQKGFGASIAEGAQTVGLFQRGEPQNSTFCVKGFGRSVKIAICYGRSFDNNSELCQSLSTAV